MLEETQDAKSDGIKRNDRTGTKNAGQGSGRMWGGAGGCLGTE